MHNTSSSLHFKQAFKVSIQNKWCFYIKNEGKPVHWGLKCRRLQSRLRSRCFPDDADIFFSADLTILECGINICLIPQKGQTRRFSRPQLTKLNSALHLWLQPDGVFPLQLFLCHFPRRPGLNFFLFAQWRQEEWQKRNTHFSWWQLWWRREDPGWREREQQGENMSHAYFTSVSLPATDAARPSHPVRSFGARLVFLALYGFTHTHSGKTAFLSFCLASN